MNVAVILLLVVATSVLGAVTIESTRQWLATLPRLARVVTLGFIAFGGGALMAAYDWPAFVTNARTAGCDICSSLRIVEDCMACPGGKARWVSSASGHGETAR